VKLRKFECEDCHVVYFAIGTEIECKHCGGTMVSQSLSANDEVRRELFADDVVKKEAIKLQEELEEWLGEIDGKEGTL